MAVDVTQKLRDCNDYLKNTTFTFLDKAGNNEPALFLWVVVHKAARVAEAFYQEIIARQKHYSEHKTERGGLPEEATCFANRLENLKQCSQLLKTAASALQSEREKLTDEVLTELLPIVDKTSYESVVSTIQAVQKQLDEHYIKSWSNFAGTTWSLGKYVEWFSSRALQEIAAAPQSKKNETEEFSKVLEAVNQNDQSKILFINQGLKIKQALPSEIKTAKDALDWLEKTGHAASLTYADFTDFKEMTEEDLKRLFSLSPNLTHLLIAPYEMKALPDLPKTLLELDCSCGSLESLPKQLPTTLRKLSCSNNSLKELPPLHQIPLEELCCGHCPLETLASLPNTLKNLFCAGCPLSQGFGEKLPDLLEKMNCSGCQLLQGLPEQLPSALRYFNCAGCGQIQKLPSIPEGCEAFLPKTLKQEVSN